MTEAATLSPPVDKPAHIPDAAVYDFDMFRDPALQRDPHARIRQILTDAPPLFWTPRNRGHWVAMGHEPIFNASRDWDNFSSSPRPPEEMARIYEMMKQPGMKYIPTARPILLDPPEHGKYRAPLASVFGPKAIKQREDEIRTLAASLLEAIAPNKKCEFISSVAEPLPVQVFLKMMGLPVDRMAEFRELVHKVLSPRPPEEVLKYQGQRTVADVLLPSILEARDNPSDNLLSLLWSSKIDGEPMTLELMEDYAGLLFIAGLDTVINGIGFGIRHLAANPDFQAELRANPDLIPQAAEELLRRYTFTIPARRVATECELEGFKLMPGEWLMLYLPGGDLDQRTYESPEQFDISREKGHIAFGAGPHRCLGSHLARLELNIIYQEVLKRLPPFRLDPNNAPTFRTGHIIAMTSLPLVWD